MRDFSRLWTATLCLSLVVACSQTEAPPPVQAEPIFNKYGDVVGCSDGSSPDGADAANPCRHVPPPPPPPPDDCVEISTGIPCPPAGEDGDREGSSTNGGRDPGGSSSTGSRPDPTGGTSTPGTPPGSSP